MILSNVAELSTSGQNLKQQFKDNERVWIVECWFKLEPAGPAVDSSNSVLEQTNNCVYSYTEERKKVFELSSVDKTRVDWKASFFKNPP